MVFSWFHFDNCTISFISLFSERQHRSSQVVLEDTAKLRQELKEQREAVKNMERMMKEMLKKTNEEDNKNKNEGQAGSLLSSAMAGRYIMEIYVMVF